MISTIEGPIDAMDRLDRELAAAAAILPAWFVPRMMSDEWSFGLLLSTGHTLCISAIDAVRRDAAGNIWLDCRMLEDDGMVNPAVRDRGVMTAPTSRLQCSINAAHVVAAFETADT